MPRPRFFSINTLSILADQIGVLLQLPPPDTPRPRSSSFSPSNVSRTPFPAQNGTLASATTTTAGNVFTVHGHEFEMRIWNPDVRFSALTTTSAEDTASLDSSETTIPRYYFRSNRDSGSSTLSDLDLGTTITRARAGSTVSSGQTLVENFASRRHMRRYSSALDSAILETSVPRIRPLVTPYFEQRAVLRPTAAPPLEPLRRHSISSPTLRFMPSFTIPALSRAPRAGVARFTTGSRYDAEAGGTFARSLTHWRAIAARAHLTTRNKIIAGIVVSSLGVVIIGVCWIILGHEHLHASGLKHEKLAPEEDDD